MNKIDFIIKCPVLFGILLPVNMYSQDVMVTAVFSVAKEYGTVKSLEREKFFNSHNSPGNEFSADEWNYLNKIKMGIGRAFMVPGGGASVANGVSVEILQKQAANWGKFSKKYPCYSPYMYKEMIVTSHPTPGKVKNYAFHWKGVNAYYTEEAKLMADFFKIQFIDNGYSLPGYYEPMNEPYVHASDYRKKGIKGATDEKVRKEMARYHKAVAMELHKHYPELKVGGFASAWPFVEGFHSDFQHWNERMKMFIDTAGDEIDFLSVHIYDGKNVKGEDTFRSGSNMEGIMDLIEGYTFIKYGHVKPLLISEHGMTRPDWLTQPYSEERDWKIIRSLNHQTVQFMSRPDNLLKCIPFISGKASWRKDPNPYPWVISKKDAKGNWEWTHLVKYFEFWSRLKGNYSKINSSEIDILPLAFVDGKKAYVVLNNLEEKKTVNLEVAVLKNNTIRDISVSRLAQKNGIPVLDEEKLKNSNNVVIDIDNGETCIVEFEYNNKVSTEGVIKNRKFYASSYLKPVKPGKEMEFEINIENGSIDKAVLQIGIARPVGQKVNPGLHVNGKKYQFPTDWKGYDQKNRTKEGFFGVIDINIEKSDIKAGTNHVSLKFADGAGTVSTAAFNVDYINE
ncbi:hypothetical protein [Bacteroides xylanisolvens]|uniref:hypothetical protein n=1 Tax=Bacteroides xylanisolvens TaxID=371601 RepID=UPI0035135749